MTYERYRKILGVTLTRGQSAGNHYCRVAALGVTLTWGRTP